MLHHTVEEDDKRVSPHCREVIIVVYGKLIDVHRFCSFRYCRCPSVFLAEDHFHGHVEMNELLIFSISHSISRTRELD